MKQWRKYETYSRFSLLLTILILLCSLTALSQSTLEMSVPRNQKNVETFTFTRINPISGIKTIDTFVNNGAGKYSLQVKAPGLPQPGRIENNSGLLRSVFLIPGLQLQVLIKTNLSQQSESVAGPWSAPDSAFQSMNTIKILQSRKAYTDQTEPGRLKLFDQLMKTVDTTAELQHRSLKDFLFYTLIREAIDSSDQL
ncbi:MAG: hypothetical protein EOO04_19720, partial [Chitinophagaceae bacterium]